MLWFESLHSGSVTGRLGSCDIGTPKSITTANIFGNQPIKNEAVQLPFASVAIVLPCEATLTRVKNQRINYAKQKNSNISKKNAKIVGYVNVLRPNL